MELRRVVTGVGLGGRPRIVDDGPAPGTHDFESTPGLASAIVWATEREEPIRADGEDPVPALRHDLPEPGATRFSVVDLPPDEVLAHADPVAAAAEQRLVTPDIAATFDPDDPGMHQTDTVDYVVVLTGEIDLELDGGDSARLRAGDVVVQNGTRHAWRNRGEATARMAFFMTGAIRARPTGRSSKR